jgi:hypothetical protein
MRDKWWVQNFFRSSEVARVSSAKRLPLVPDAIFAKVLLFALHRNDFTQEMKQASQPTF